MVSNYQFEIKLETGQLLVGYKNKPTDDNFRLSI